jgi:hypothetical protein
MSPSGSCAPHASGPNVASAHELLDLPERRILTFALVCGTRSASTDPVRDRVDQALPSHRRTIRHRGCGRLPAVGISSQIVDAEHLTSGARRSSPILKKSVSVARATSDVVSVARSIHRRPILSASDLLR